MKTTLELPDGLMLQVKLRAVHRGQKLKDAVAQLLEAAIAAEGGAHQPRRAPVPVKLKGPPLTDDAIEEAIRAGRD